jgi:putative ABC transport system permease protein
MSEMLGYLERNWTEVTSAGAYNYFFIDQSIQQLHNADQRTGQVFSYFAGLAILIACLGLFGLASYMTIKREKEVGIRKVFGANVRNIVVLLSKDFIRLVSIGFIIATPIAYLAMNSWLQNFAYHTEIGIWIFISAGFIALAVSMLSVSYQSAKAAFMNPVKSIRNE